MSEIKNWKVMSDISDEDEQCEFIRTGIKKLDQSIQGLILGATSIWTGTNGSNKSGTGKDGNFHGCRFEGSNQKNFP